MSPRIDEDPIILHIEPEYAWTFVAVVDPFPPITTIAVTVNACDRKTAMEKAHALIPETDSWLFKSVVEFRDV
jgi:hypothetical protein